MPSTRRRPESEFESTGAQTGQQIVTLSSLTGGLNTYTSPELMSPQMWAACSNVYSGLFGTIRRARWAPLINSSTTGYTPTSVRMTSMFGVYYPLQNPWLFFDTNGQIWWYDMTTHTATLLDQSLALFLLTAWNLTGPFMRLGMGGALLFQTNGHARSKIYVNQNTNQPNLELDGIDAPDAAPSVSTNVWSSPEKTTLVYASNITTIVSTSNVVTVTPAVGAIGSPIPINGDYVTIYGVTDSTFNSPVGVAYLVTGATTTTFTYSAVGPNRSSSGGTVTNGILLNVGRSYEYAWENANTGHVSAPSPASQYTTYSRSYVIASVASSTGVYTGTFPDGGSNGLLGYAILIGGFVTNAVNNGTFYISASTTTTITTSNSASVSETHAATAQTYQNGTIAAIEPGTIAYNSASTTVTGTNTFFTSAWVGRSIVSVSASLSTSATDVGRVASVSSATSLTLSANAGGTGSGLLFNVYDEQATHLRFYATADGQATYLRLARNAFNPNYSGGILTSSLFGSGLGYRDTADSEPPNPPFTNELSQTENVPPPIASYQQDYQGRRLLFGVPASPQSFFYSNMEATVVGQPPESFAPLNVVTLPIGDGQINGMANLPTGCMMWSNRQEMFKLTGTLTDNTIANSQQLGSSIQRLPYRIGCASPYATTVTSLGCFWLSSDREVWLFTDHYAPKNVGKPIQTLLNSATRINFARMDNYKSGDRNWIALAITTQGGSFNDTLCLLDLDLLASNGQPSFFTFDMATNQPSWYVYNTNCEAIESAFDSSSINHLLTGDVDLVTDVDWQSSYYTVGTEQTVPAPGVTLHAVGNEAPEVIKTGKWMRVTTNQYPKYLASQGWYWQVLVYDDDKYILGVNPQTVKLIPGTNSQSEVFGLESSPALFKFGASTYVKGRRFQLQAVFPSTPGFWELRSYQFCFDSIVAR